MNNNVLIYIFVLANKYLNKKRSYDVPGGFEDF